MVDFEALFQEIYTVVRQIAGNFRRFGGMSYLEHSCDRVVIFAPGGSPVAISRTVQPTLHISENLPFP